MATELQTMDARRAVWDCAEWCQRNSARVVGLNERLSGNLTFTVKTEFNSYRLEVFVEDESARVEMPSSHRNRRIENRNLARRLPAAIEAGDAPVREARAQQAAAEAEAAEQDRAALELFTPELIEWCRTSRHVTGVRRPGDLMRSDYITVYVASYSPRSRRIILDAMREAEACDAAEAVCKALRSIGRGMRFAAESGETRRVA